MRLQRALGYYALDLSLKRARFPFVVGLILPNSSKKGVSAKRLEGLNNNQKDLVDSARALTLCISHTLQKRRSSFITGEGRAHTVVSVGLDGRNIALWLIILLIVGTVVGGAPLATAIKTRARVRQQ